jgi:hypothetical protein
MVSIFNGPFPCAIVSLMLVLETSTAYLSGVSMISGMSAFAQSIYLTREKEK